MFATPVFPASSATPSNAPSSDTGHDSDELNSAQDITSPLSLILLAHERTSQAACTQLEQRLFKSKADKLPKLDPIACGICSVTEATRLYGLFFTRLSGFCGFLDSRLHTYEFVAAKSDFLLSVILQAAARRDVDPQFSQRSSTIALGLMNHIREVIWPEILVKNYRSVQVCQAMMVFSTWASSTDLGDEDPSWSIFGHALRIAVELGLHRNFERANEGLQASLLIRDAQRYWMTCFLADRSWALQLSRPALVPESSLTLGSRAWLADPDASLEDSSIVALICLRRILARLHDPSPQETQVSSYESTLRRQELEAWRLEWLRPAYANSCRLGSAGQIYYHYALILHYGHTFHSGNAQALENIAMQAGLLCRHAAEELADRVLECGHNNIFTMILYACYCAFRTRHHTACASTGQVHSGQSHPNPALAQQSYETYLAVCSVEKRLHAAADRPPHRHDAASWAWEKLRTLTYRWSQEYLPENQHLEQCQVPLSAQQPEQLDFETAWQEFISGQGLLNLGTLYPELALNDATQDSTQQAETDRSTLGLDNRLWA